MAHFLGRFSGEDLEDSFDGSEKFLHIFLRFVGVFF